MDAGGAVDAENAPTAPWKSLRDSHKRPQPFSFVGENTPTNTPRACARVGTQTILTAAYRVAAFQTFPSGRISTFGDSPVARPRAGPIVAILQVGGLHHRYERRAA